MTNEEYKIMLDAADSVYKNGRQNIPDGYKWVHSFQDKNKNGFQAVVFKNEITNEYIISFAGTQDLQDAHADIKLGWEQWNGDTRMKVFEYIEDEIIAKSAAKIHFTGHSLGGALAQYALYEYISTIRIVDHESDELTVPVDITTFNSLGGLDGLVQYLPESNSFRSEIISDIEGKHFFVEGDLVSRLGGGHIAGTTSKLVPSGVNNLNLIDAHPITTLKTIINLDEFTWISFQQPDYLNIQNLQQFAGELSTFFNFGTDVDNFEGGNRLLAVVLGIVGNYSQMNAIDEASGQLNELLIAVFENFEIAAINSTQKVAFEALKSIDYEALLNLASQSKLGDKFIGTAFVSALLAVAIDEAFSEAVHILELPEVWRDRMPYRQIVSLVYEYREELPKIGLPLKAMRLMKLLLADQVLPELSSNSFEIQEGKSDVMTLTLSEGYEDDLSILIKVHNPERLVITGESVSLIDDVLGKYYVTIPEGITQIDLDVYHKMYGDITDADAEIDFYLVPLNEINGQLVNSGQSSTTLTLTEYQLPETEADPVMNHTILGDYEWKDFDKEKDGIQVRYDDLGNPVTTDNLEVQDDTLNGGNGSDLIISGAGQDSVSAKDGKDYIFLGDDQDIADGGAENDRLEGGADSDILIGGAGNDRLFANEQSDLKTISAPDTVISGIDRDWLSGGDGDDLLVGSTGQNGLSGGGGIDTIYGGSGDDFIMGDRDIVVSDHNWKVHTAEGEVLFEPAVNAIATEEGQGDFVYGGAGNDRIWGETGDDHLSGQAGNDKISGGEANDSLSGGDGNDELSGDSDLIEDSEHGNDYLEGGNGEDILNGGGRNDILFGGSGNDVIHGDSSELDIVFHGNDNLFGGYGDDELIGYGGDDTLSGGEDNDRLFGDSEDLDDAEHGDDRLNGDAGQDILVGGGGQDVLIGGDGADELLGDSSDVAEKFHGNDWLSGSAGDDTLTGFGGDDILMGGDDNDILHGDSDAMNDDSHGHDHLDGGSGDDLLIGGGGRDILDGEQGNDKLYGDSVYLGERFHDNDRIYGKSGDDELIGGGGDDRLDGGDDNDVLWGQAGDDILIGGNGADQMSGGQGNDSYFYTINQGNDVILDEGGSADKLTLAGITPDDFYFSRDNSILVISIRSTGEQVSLDDWFDDGLIESIEIGGSIWNKQAILDELQQVSTQGSNGNDILIGSDKADILNGLSGDDVLQGKKGNDVLYGGSNNDVYKINVDDGRDVIYDVSGRDKIILGKGLTPDNIKLTQSDNHLMIIPVGSSDQVIVQNWFTIENQIESIHFSDGSLFTVEQISNETRENQSQIITGTSGDDELHGGLGNDFLYGGSGNDNYHFNLGDGIDIIDDNLKGGTQMPAENVLSTGNDTLIFGPGITPEQLHLAKVDSTIESLEPGVPGIPSGDLSIDINDNDKVIIKDWFADSFTVGSTTFLPPKIEQFKFENGFVLGNHQIQQLLNNEPINFEPAVNIALEQQRLELNQFFLLTLPEDMFSDPEDDSLSYHVTLTDGSELPSWLNFDSQSKTLSGTPTSNDTARLVIRITATDIVNGSTSQIFNLIVGDVPDVLSGTVADDILSGDVNDDYILGLSGNDALYGEDGHDQLKGGAGNDVLYADKAYGRNPGNDSLYGGSGNDRLYAYEGDDLLYGNEGDDILYGSYGHDTLEGGSGHDDLLGGADNDIYRFGIDSDTDDINDQQGKNRIELSVDITPSMVSFSLDKEDLILSVANISSQLRYQSFAHFNQETGNYEQFVDNLNVVFSDGTLWNVESILEKLIIPVSDIQNGTNENDIYFVDSSYDVINEVADGGQDLVKSSVSYVLPENIENIDLTGTLSINAEGNSLDNQIFGNSGHNILDGKSGHNSFWGGEGDDIYIMHDDTLGTVTENDNEGQDTISFRGSDYRLHSYTMPDFIENLNVRYTSSYIYNIKNTLQGNELDNYIFIDSPDNVYDANGEPVFFVKGGDGSDKIIIDSSAPYYLLGENGDDTLYGDSGADFLDGGQGIDYLHGGAGLDTYLFKPGDDRLGESLLIDQLAGTTQNPRGNRIFFDVGIKPQDVWFEEDDVDLILHYSKLDKVRIVGGVDNNDIKIIGEYEFSDGTVFTEQVLRAQSRDITVNHAPVAQTEQFTVNEDKILMIPFQDVLSNDSDSDGDVLTITQVDNAINGQLEVSNDATIIFKPDADFNGRGYFHYQISDGKNGFSQAQVTINVTPVNDAPEAQTDWYTLYEDQILTIPQQEVLSNDSDSEDDVLTITQVDNAINGQVESGNDGTIFFKPDADFNGLGSFDYQISDGNNGFSQTQVTINIAPVNDAPELETPLAEQKLIQGEAFSLQIPDNTFSDPDSNDNLTLSIGQADGLSLPDWLQFDAKNGVLSGVPEQVHNGTLELLLTVTDSGDLSVTEKLFLTIESKIQVADDIHNDNPIGSTDVGQVKPIITSGGNHSSNQGTASDWLSNGFKTYSFKELLSGFDNGKLWPGIKNHDPMHDFIARSEQLRLSGRYSQVAPWVKKNYSSETALEVSAVSNLINAMAVFDVPTGIDVNLMNDEQARMERVITAGW